MRDLLISVPGVLLPAQMQLACCPYCRQMVQRLRDLRWRPVAVAALLLVSLIAGVYLTRIRLQRRNWPSGRLPPVEANTSAKHLGRYFLTGLKSAHTVAPGEEPYEASSLEAA